MFDGLRKLFTAEDWMPARRVLQRDAEWWNKLRNDCFVRFGFMPQKELSGKRLEIGDHTLYQFGSGRFIAHQLLDESKPVAQMIVANAPQQQVYLAISRRLDERDISNLFADDEFDALPDLSRFSKLYIREHTPGVKDWVTMQYHRRIEGVRGQKTSSSGGTRTFRYFLFVSESNDKALEIEWFDDGTYEAYATLYRPLSDIVQVQHERRATPRGTPENEARSEPRLGSDAAVAGAEIIELPAVTKEVAEAGSSSTVSLSSTNLTIVETGQVEALHLPHLSAADQSLTCDIRVASKIIDEAIRNDMQLGDIVRRVLGLPVTISETVNFHVPLTDSDYKNLAKRYGVPESDRERIRECIVEDLIDFTGERSSQPTLKRAK
ncbi:MAG: hypothetical protein K2Q12_02265 [Rickettsiales bacterium]|nr:hypothetical protein [Rickettsiales bacterium]